MLFLVNPFWITSAKALSAGVGTFVVGGQAAAFARALGLPAAAGAIVLSGKAAGLLYNRRVDAEAAAFALTGMQAQFISQGKIAAQPGAFTLGGQAANLRSARLLSADPGSFALTGQDAILRFGKTLPADRGVFAITGNEAGLLRSLIASAGPGAFSVTGQDAGLLRALLLTASAGAYVLSGQAAALVRRFTLIAAAGGFALSGQAAGLNRGRSLVAGVGSYALAGQAAALTYDPGVVTSLSFVTSGTSVGATIDVPATAQAGDLGILIQYSRSSASIPTSVDPWSANQVIDTNFGSARALISFKELDAGDLGATLTGMDGDATDYKTILIVRPNGSINTITGFSATGEATVGDPAAKSISTTGQAAPVILIGHAACNNGAPTTSGTLKTNGTELSNSNQRVVYEIQTGTLADRGYDMTDAGQVNALQACGIAVA